MQKTKTAARPQRIGALKINEVCEFLGGISKPTVYRLVRDGLLKPNKHIRRVLIFPIAEVERFLHS